MKKASHLLFAIFLFSMLLTACGSNTSTPLSNYTDAIATIVAATLSAIPPTTPEEGLLNTPFPTETLTPTSIPTEPLDRTNIESVLKWISYAITENKPEMISDVIGDNGVSTAKYAAGFDFTGYNNSEIVVSDLRQALQNATPHCMGYEMIINPPDRSKANVYFSGIKYDWGDYVVAFSLFYMDNGWELVVRSAVYTDWWPNIYQRLWSCP
jgi:hypothetical protein